MYNAIEEALKTIYEDGKVILKSNHENRYTANDLFRKVVEELDKEKLDYNSFDLSIDKILVELDIEEDEEESQDGNDNYYDRF